MVQIEGGEEKELENGTVFMIDIRLPSWADYPPASIPHVLERHVGDELSENKFICSIRFCRCTPNSVFFCSIWLVQLVLY